MAKRGESYPWKLYFQWPDGPRHKEAFFSEDAANTAAVEIRQNAEQRGREVSIDIRYEPAASKRPSPQSPAPKKPATAGKPWRLTYPQPDGKSATETFASLSAAELEAHNRLAGASIMDIPMTVVLAYEP